MRRLRSAVLTLLTCLALATPAHATLFGFNDNAVGQDIVTPADDARLLAGVGTEVHRLTFNWRFAEPTKGRYHFGFYDKIYEADLARGVRPLFILMYAPDWTWARGRACPPDVQCPYPPDASHLGAWKRMVTKLVRRYPKLAGLEVWNEPNLDVFFKPRPDARQYTRLVKTAYRAVQREGSEIPVLAGSLANAPATSAAPGVDAHDFLKGMYRAGAAGHYEALSVHPYTLGNDLAPMFKTLTDVGALRDRYRDRTPLWVTEIGTTTTGQVSEDQQAALLVRLVGILGARPGIDAVLLHTLIEPPFGASGETGYGIVHQTGLPKPAYCALARLRLRTPSDCVLSVLAPAAAQDAAQNARWDAQLSVQAAVDAAIAHARAHGGSLADFTTGTPEPGADAAPGRRADPAAVGVYRFSSVTLLCAASRADASYCAMHVLGRWSYGHALGPIGLAAQNTIAGTSRSW